MYLELYWVAVRQAAPLFIFYDVLHGAGADAFAPENPRPSDYLTRFR